MKKLYILLVGILLISNLYCTANDWEGEWQGVHSNQFTQSALTIKNCDNKSFDFYLFVNNGSHFGEIEGKANINKNEAVFSDEYGCDVTFTIFKNEKIKIKFTDGCQYYAGAGTFFDYEYAKNIKINQLDLIELQVLKDKKEDDTFKKLTGKDYNLFVNSMQIISEDKDIDNLNARVISGGVTGLFTINEAIIMITNDKLIWCAVINENQVFYFTNAKKFTKNLPKTIEKWRERFKDKKVIYK